MKTLGWLQSIRLPHLYTATPAKENVLKRTECATESGFTCLTYWNSSEFFDGFVGSMAVLWWLSHHVTVKVCPVNPFGSIRIRGCMKKVVGGDSYLHLSIFFDESLKNLTINSKCRIQFLICLSRKQKFDNWMRMDWETRLFFDRLIRLWSSKMIKEIIVLPLEKNKSISIIFIFFTTFC